MNGKKPIKMGWLKLRTRKSKNHLSEFSEKSEENRIQGTDGGIGPTQEMGGCLFY